MSEELPYDFELIKIKFNKTGELIITDKFSFGQVTIHRQDDQHELYLALKNKFDTS